MTARIVEKTVNKDLKILNLNAMKLSQLPDFSRIMREMQGITELNLAKNNLFNTEQVFQSLSNLGNLVKLNLSHNFLNGVLSSYIGDMTQIEEINMSVNQLSVLPASMGNLTNLKVLLLADNSISEIPLVCYHIIFVCIKIKRYKYINI